MKLVIDGDRCEANGVCVRAAPEAFFLDEKDSLHLLQEAVTPGLRAKVAQAVRACPRQALSFTVDAPAQKEGADVA
ncbi:ferredoxin [Stigmatella sp. ncwal1]|uniref:Ferredoxin n=1 Tax=Stigmatella ashevillensis TaxID=2995309 RepID=A0ABT5D4T2_9BACT|nr:ferredoxin [Stigmatella ashevillena]MDC0708670.1 ferredoxin [Stigmatella ashevillena]